MPTLFGANFQGLSVAQRILSDVSSMTGTAEAGGYVQCGKPNPLVHEALQHIDGVIGSLVAALEKRGLRSTTAIVLTGKHGNSPVPLGSLQRVDSGVLDKVCWVWGRGVGGCNMW